MSECRTNTGTKRKLELPRVFEMDPCYCSTALLWFSLMLSLYTRKYGDSIWVCVFFVVLCLPSFFFVVVRQKTAPEKCTSRVFAVRRIPSAYLVRKYKCSRAMPRSIHLRIEMRSYARNQNKYLYTCHSRKNPAHTRYNDAPVAHGDTSLPTCHAFNTTYTWRSEQ